MRIEFEREADGRWLAELAAIPGVMAYGETYEEARARVRALALSVMADRLEHGESDLKMGPLERRHRRLDYFHNH
jgi:predicted RNase H-like HicB family nuclease